MSGRAKAIIFMNGFSLLSSLYMVLARIATNTGINAIDLCFVRTTGTFLSACFTVVYNKKNIISGVPTKWRLLVFCRSIMGFVAFTCALLACKYLPLFVVAIVWNLCPFIVALLAWLINGESVDTGLKICMVACFIGVVILSLAKKN